MTVIRRNWFRERRLELGLTLSAMAIAADVSPQTIGNWESGRVRPEPHRAEQMAKAYDVSVDEIAREIIRLATDKDAA